MNCERVYLWLAVCLSVCPTPLCCVQLTLYFPHNKLLFHFISIHFFFFSGCSWFMYVVWRLQCTRISLFVHLGFFFLSLYICDLISQVVLRFILFLLACFGITFLFSFGDIHSITLLLWRVLLVISFFFCSLRFSSFFFAKRNNTRCSLYLYFLYLYIIFAYECNTGYVHSVRADAIE